MTAPLTPTEHDAEALLTGTYADGDLSEVAEVLSIIRAAGRREAATDFSQLIAAAVMESRATPVARFAAEQEASKVWERTARVARPVAVGAVAVFMLIVSSAGLAYAANGAKPGDFLYGLDRAAEVIGIGDGGAAERLDEAQALVAEGEMPFGLTHAAAVIANNQEAQDAVTEAAFRLEGGPPGPDSQTPEKVRALLTHIRDALGNGGVIGSDVAMLARAIGGPEGEGAPPFAEDGTEDVTPDDSTGTPGQSGDAPGQDGDTPGNTENAPGPVDEGPPGQQDEGTPGNTENAPGQEDETETAEEDAPGQSEDAPGQGGDAPGDSENTPGATNPGGGGPP